MRSNSVRSVVGIRFGSDRSVIEAMPIGTSGSVCCSRRASRFARDEPRRVAGRRARAHRERRVEEDERLRVGALAHELLADDDRLRSRNRDERGEEDERDHDRDDRPPARPVQRRARGGRARRAAR